MVKITIEQKELKLKRPFKISRGERVLQPNGFLELITESALGHGEAAVTGFGAHVPQLLLDEMQKGKRTCIQQVEKALRLPAPAETVDCAVGQFPPDSPFRCAMETAIVDLLAAKADEPVWRLLGLSAGDLPVSSFTLGIDTPETMAEKLEEAAAFPILKIKLGSEHDEEVLKMVRNYTDALIRVDANGGWTPGIASERIRLCADYGVELIEQPLPAGMLDETARLAENSPLPIIVDEDCRTVEDLEKLKGKVQGVNVKLRKAGGLWSAYRLICEAVKNGLKVMIGCFIESSLAVTAAAHLGSMADWLDLDGHELISNDPFCGIDWQNGKITLPSRPGIGIIEAV